MNREESGSRAGLTFVPNVKDRSRPNSCIEQQSNRSIDRLPVTGQPTIQLIDSIRQILHCAGDTALNAIDRLMQAKKHLRSLTFQ